MNIKLVVRKLTQKEKINISFSNIFNIYSFNEKKKILINWKDNTRVFIRKFNLYKQSLLFSEFDSYSDIYSDSDSDSHSDSDSDSDYSKEQRIFLQEFTKYDIVENSSDDNYNIISDNDHDSESDVELDFDKIERIHYK